MARGHVITMKEFEMIFSMVDTNNDNLLSM